MKRCYKEAAVSHSPAGSYRVLLDGKAIKTPRRALISLPNLSLAEAIAAEWREQGDEIDPRIMPLTRLAYAAIDVVMAERTQVTQQMLNYAEHDLLCYRAEEPPELVARQARVWGPLLDWAAETYGARLNLGFGIRHAAQPPEAIAALDQTISHYDEFELAALHTATTISGSLILAVALADKEVNAEGAFAAATLDETFQAEKWGQDAEAEKRRGQLFAELTAVERFLRLLDA